MMTNDQYMEFTRSTAIYPKDRELEYLGLGLAGEAGEVAGKISKVIRDRNGIMSAADRVKITDESSDVLWFLTRVCDVLGISLDDLKTHNVNKLSDRKDRGVLGGDGDKR